MNRSERRAAASSARRVMADPDSGTGSRRDVLRAHADAIVDAWTDHVERTHSLDSVVLVVDRSDPAVRKGLGDGDGVEFSVFTHAASLQFVLQTPAPVGVVAKARAPLPEADIRVVVVAGGGVDVVDVALGAPGRGGEHAS